MSDTSTRLFDWCGENAIGSVVLSGFSAGQRTEALLVSLDVCLSGDADMCNIVEKILLFVLLLIWVRRTMT